MRNLSALFPAVRDGDAGALLMLEQVRRFDSAQCGRGNRRDELIGGADRWRSELAGRTGTTRRATQWVLANDQIQQIAAVIRLLHRIEITLDLIG